MDLDLLGVRPDNSLLPTLSTSATRVRWTSEVGYGGIVSALRATVLVCCFWVWVLSCSAAQERLTEALTDKADAVVVAGVRYAHQSGKLVAFTLTVNRSLKGDFIGGA